MQGINPTNQPIHVSDKNFFCFENDITKKGVLALEGFFEVRNIRDARYIGTHGVQTCTALFIYDKNNQTGGVAHINTNCPEIIVDAIEKLISKVKPTVNNDNKFLDVHVVGGYNIHLLCNNNGSESTLETIKQLELKGFKPHHYPMPINHILEMAHPYLDLQTGELIPNTIHWPFNNLKVESSIRNNLPFFYSNEIVKIFQDTRTHLMPIKYSEQFGNRIFDQTSKSERSATNDEIYLSKIIDSSNKQDLNERDGKIKNYIENQTPALKASKKKNK